MVYTFFKLVSPLVFLAAAALYVYGTDPIGKGAMLDAAAVVGAALLGSKLPDLIAQEHAAEAAREHPQGPARLARHAGDLRRGRACRRTPR